MMNNDFHNLLSHSISSFSKEKANQKENSTKHTFVYEKVHSHHLHHFAQLTLIDSHKHI